MYITSTEYNTITGRAASEATTYRITVASKLLDSRIGDYLVQVDGYKINSSTWKMWICGVLTEISQVKKDAVQLWVSQMVSFLTDNNNLPSSQTNNVRLGRFSIGKNIGSGNSNTSQLPDEMSFADGILVSSGIIKRSVSMA